MKNPLLVLGVFTLCATAAIDAPKLGYVRLPDRTLHILRGTAGSFHIGDTVLEGVDRFAFDGHQGMAMVNGVSVPIASEKFVENEAELPAKIDGDELVISATGARVTLPFPVSNVERAGEEYLLLSGESEQALVRFVRGREAIYVLPAHVASREEKVKGQQ